LGTVPARLSATDWVVGQQFVDAGTSGKLAENAIDPYQRCGVNARRDWAESPRIQAFQALIRISAWNNGDMRGWFDLVSGCYPGTDPPTCRGFAKKRLMGFEPTTFCMASRRSSQLSYSRIGRGL
jgi:hypothetical protein